MSEHSQSLFFANFCCISTYLLDRDYSPSAKRP